MDPGPPAGRHALRGIGRTGPAHYGVDEIPLDRLAGRAATIEATDLGAGDLLGVGRIEAWEEEHDSIEAGDRVLIRYGWDYRWTTGPEGRRFLEDWPLR